MGRPSESFKKREVKKKKDQKRKVKDQKKQERKESEGKPDFDDMIAYVDQYGNITDTPPDPEEQEEISADDIELSHEKEDPTNEDGLRSGIITFFNDEKGFGFIRDLETEQSVFVHISNIEEPVAENNKVLFEMGNGEKGPIALNVKVDR